jgi:predicted ATPase
MSLDYFKLNVSQNIGQISKKKLSLLKEILNEDYPEAVKNFRIFMVVIKQVPDEKYMDPYTGQQISVDSILGLNAVRIAGLWEKAGDTEQAKAAYKEAVEYYTAALEKEKKDSDQYQSIQKQLKQLEGK